LRPVYLILTLATTTWCQSAGLRGHSANAHGPAQWPGYLGVGIIEMTADRAKALNLPEVSGVEVTRIDDSSPAVHAGLKVSDVILFLNGQKLQTGVQFITMIGVTAPGSKVALTVWREGKKLNLEATLDSRPAQQPAYVYRTEPDSMPPGFEVMPLPSPVIGIDGETLTPQLAEYFGVKEGVLIRTVGLRTPAEKAGLKAGDVVVKVNDVPVDSIREISGVIRQGGKAFSFTVMRNRKQVTLNLELALNFEPCPDPQESASQHGSFLALFRLR
jgi:serine protease Do